MPASKQAGATTLYVSHGAGGGPTRPEVAVDWFIVEPRDRPEPLAAQVEWLRRSGRTVIELGVVPYDERSISVRMVGEAS